MRALGYFRVEGGQDESSAAEMQWSFEEFCTTNLHQPIEIFASDARLDDGPDPEYSRMREFLAKSGGQYLVVVPDATHLASDLEGVARTLIELDRTGAKAACLDDEFPDPLQNAFQTLGVKGVSRTRSIRVKESMRARASKGLALGRPLYGYRIGDTGTLEIVPEEAAVVELIFRLYTRDRIGFRLIAQHLNERGIQTRRGGNWSVVGVRDVLGNLAYTGTYTRLGMRRGRAHEAIVAPELFRAAQDQTRERRPSGRVMRPKPFPLSGILYCAYCGNKMIGVTRRQAWKRKDGRRQSGVYRYYQCQSRLNQSRCGYHTWRESLLESTVVTQLKYALQNRASDSSGDGDAEAPDRAQSIRQSILKNAEGRFLKAMKRTAKGEMSLQVLGEYLGELDAARGRAAATDESRNIAEKLAEWDGLDLEERRALLAENVQKVVVEDERVEVVV